MKPSLTLPAGFAKLADAADLPSLDVFKGGDTGFLKVDQVGKRLVHHRADRLPVSQIPAGSVVSSAKSRRWWRAFRTHLDEEPRALPGIVRISRARVHLDVSALPLQ